MLVSLASSQSGVVLRCERAIAKVESSRHVKHHECLQASACHEAMSRMLTVGGTCPRTQEGKLGMAQHNAPISGESHPRSLITQRKKPFKIRTGAYRAPRGWSHGSDIRLGNQGHPYG